MYKLLVLLSALMLTAPFATILAVQPDCDPFSDFYSSVQSSCPGSNSIIRYGANGTVLILTSTLSDCGHDRESASVFFSRLETPKIDSNSGDDTYIFSYSIMWTNVSTNCVVDVTSTTLEDNPKQSYDLPKDMNGLNNNPLTNISLYALNQWYTRSFVINRAALPAFRFGFTCASQTPGSEQVAYVRDISWSSGPKKQMLYSSLRSCINCEGFIADTDCKLIDNEYRWVYEGNVELPPGTTFVADAPLTVTGDVRVSALAVRKSLNIQGCLYNNPQNNDELLSIRGYRESTVTIRQTGGCTLPEFAVGFAVERAYNDTDFCDYMTTTVAVKDGATAVTNVTADSITIYVPNDAFECVELPKGTSVLVIILVPLFVGCAAIVIGIVFGVRRWKQKQRRRAQQLDLEMEQQQDLEIKQ